MSHLNLEISRKCNQKCFYCFNNSGISEKTGIISFESWQTILGMMHESGLKSVHITGGEPFMWSKTIDLLCYAQNIGLDTSILSNGFQIDSLAKTHADVLINLKVAQISLDSMHPKIHDYRRGCEGAWQQAMDAIAALRELNVSVEISCVVDDENVSELIAIGNFAKSIGASLIVRPLVSKGRASTTKISSLCQKRLEKSLIELKQANVNVVCDRFSYVPVIESTDEQNWQQNIFTIEPDGRFRGSRGFVYGNSSITNALELLQVS
ncbi:radical SAM protein [Scytonema sp. UIC 10036]|uniref:radical SAM protein n=1 Tax=Scytonema sp. UIC 10036 TaxID=2304196 RepID=UPI0012DA9A87